MGKQYRQPLPKKASRVTAPLKLVHNKNLCGNMNTMTLAGSSSFMTPIDDYSWRISVYFFKSKDTVHDLRMGGVSDHTPIRAHTHLQTCFPKWPAVDVHQLVNSSACSWTYAPPWPKHQSHFCATTSATLLHVQQLSINCSHIGQLAWQNNCIFYLSWYFPSIYCYALPAAT